MLLEFDKEIVALTTQAAIGVTASDGPPPSKHIEVRVHTRGLKLNQHTVEAMGHKRVDLIHLEIAVDDINDVDLGLMTLKIERERHPILDSFEYCVEVNHPNAVRPAYSYFYKNRRSVKKFIRRVNRAIKEFKSHA